MAHGSHASTWQARRPSQLTEIGSGAQTTRQITRRPAAKAAQRHSLRSRRMRVVTGGSLRLLARRLPQNTHYDAVLLVTNISAIWSSLGATSRRHKLLQIVSLGVLLCLLIAGGFGLTRATGSFPWNLRNGGQEAGYVGAHAAHLTPQGAPQIDLANPSPGQYVNLLIGHMSLDEEIGQLFIAEFLGDTYDQNAQMLIQRYHAGGLILYTQNMATPNQTRQLIATAQAHAYLPLLVTVDEEGGSVDRLRAFDGPHPAAAALGDDNSTATTYAAYATIAQQMRSLGMNLDLAPDADIKLVNGPDQGTRTFGSTPQQVTQQVSAALAGLQQNGVIGTLKHFPGLGAANIDAHLGLPVITRTRSQIDSVELAPYRALISSGQAQVIMTTDLLMPALDPHLPAELSPTIINGVLRGDLGYQGVVMTDALYMQGITNTYTVDEAGVLALLAGDDLLVGPMHWEVMASMVNAIHQALASGRLAKARLDASVRRILLLKLHMGLIAMPSRSVVAASGLGADGAVAMRDAIPPQYLTAQA